MSFKIKDPKDPSKEIEVFTAEEIAAAKTGAAPDAAAIKKAQDDAITEYKKNNPDKSGEVETLKNTLATKTAELEAAIALGGDEAGRKEQIERLRGERDTANKALTDKIGNLETKIASMEAGSIATAKEAALSRLVGNDKDARAKVELAFDKYDPTNNTVEGINARMEAAVAISGVKVAEQPHNMDGNGGMGGQRGTGGNNGAPVTVTDNAKKIGANLGVTEKELQDLADKKAGKTA